MAEDQYEPGKFVIYSIPDNTKKLEILNFLKSGVPDVYIPREYLSIYVPPSAKKWNGNVKTLMAFCEVYNNKDRDAIMAFYEMNNSNGGIYFKNKEQISSKLTFALCVRPKHRNTDNQNYKHKSKSNSKKSHTLKNEQIIENSDSLITTSVNTANPHIQNEKTQVLRDLFHAKEEWEREKQGLLGFIHILEETLKEKSPVLFVPQLELSELRNKVKTVEQEITEKTSDLNKAEKELNELKQDVMLL